MKVRTVIATVVTAFVLLSSTLLGQTSLFNFQGRLNDGGAPANGHYDLQFRLYDAISGGVRIGPVANRPDTVVINGVFSTTLSFGNTAFRTGEERFLEISVRPTGSQNEYVVLGARQQLLTVPFAVKASLADHADTANSATTATDATNSQNAASLGGVGASGYARLNFQNAGNLQTTGSVGFGTVAPNTRLTLSGGAPWTTASWTASMNMQNGSAFGWEANGSGQRFGIGQTNNGLHFFRTISGFGSTLTPAEYDMVITDSGNLSQPAERSGLPKGMVFVDPTLPSDQYIVRCYNGVTGSSSGNCGFTMTRVGVGQYRVNFGFQVSDRFYSATAATWARTVIAQTSGSHSVEVDARTILVDPGAHADASFYLIVF
jgi:hypothetical protein